MKAGLAASLAIVLLAATAVWSPSHAYFETEYYRDCTHLKAGAEAPLGKYVIVRGIAILDRGILYRGRTLEKSEYVDGDIRLGGDADLHPLFPVAILETPPDELHFLVPDDDTAFIVLPNAEDGDEKVEQEIWSGRLTGIADIVDELMFAEPVFCIRLPGARFMQEYTGPEVRAGGSLRDSIALPDGRARKAERPHRGGSLTAIVTAEGDGATREGDGPDRSPSITEIVVDSHGRPAKGAGKLSELVVAGKAGEEETGAEPDKSVEAEPEKPVDKAEPESAVKVCSYDAEAPEPVFEGDPPDDPIMAAGIVKSDEPLTAYWYDNFTRDLQTYGFQSRLQLPANTLTRIIVPGLRTYKVDDENVFPVRLTDMSDLIVDIGNPEPEAPATDPLAFAVFGDRASVGLSGLDGLERELKKKGLKNNWSIDWYEVQADGSLSDKVTVGSFAELVGLAGDDSEPAYLSEPETFDRFVTAMEDVIVSNDKPLDQVFWVMEGYIVPNSAPTRLESFLGRINDVGKVTRDEDGSPYKWLQVIAGYFAQEFSRAYIAGPIATSKPVAGYMSVEDREGERTVLLTNPIYPLTTIEIALRRNQSATEPAGTATKYDPGALAYDSKQVFDRIGIVVEKDFAGQISQSINAVATAAREIAKNEDYKRFLSPDTLDLTALFEISTDDTGKLTGLELNPVTFERRVKLFLKRKDLEQFEAHLDTITRSLLELENRYSETGCTHYFLPDSALGSSWEGK